MATMPNISSGIACVARCLLKWIGQFASIVVTHLGVGGSKVSCGRLEQDGILLLSEAESRLSGYEDPVRRGVYERKEAKTVKRVLLPGDRVIELGAGIGFLTMCIAHVVGEDNVLAVEANPDALGVARRNFELNGRSIRLENAILRNRKERLGDADLFVNRRFFSSSQFERPDTVKRISVPTRALEDLIDEFGANVLVVDIEGAEVNLLRGADLSKIDALILETHYRVAGVEATNVLIRHLIEQGFYLDLLHIAPEVLHLHRGPTPARRLAYFHAPGQPDAHYRSVDRSHDSNQL